MRAAPLLQRPASWIGSSRCWRKPMTDLSEQELQALRAIHEMPEGLKKEQLIAEIAKRFKVSRKVIRLELARLVVDDEARAEETAFPRELVVQGWPILMEPDQLAALR